MNSTYQEKSINCLKCNCWLCKVVVKPEIIEFGLKCEKEHRHIIEIDRKSGEIKSLIEKSEND